MVDTAPRSWWLEIAPEEDDELDAADEEEAMEDATEAEEMELGRERWDPLFGL